MLPGAVLATNCRGLWSNLRAVVLRDALGQLGARVDLVRVWPRPAGNVDRDVCRGRPRHRQRVLHGLAAELPLLPPGRKNVPRTALGDSRAQSGHGSVRCRCFRVAGRHRELGMLRI